MRMRFRPVRCCGTRSRPPRRAGRRCRGRALKVLGTSRNVCWKPWNKRSAMETTWRRSASRSGGGDCCRGPGNSWPTGSRSRSAAAPSTCCSRWSRRKANWSAKIAALLQRVCGPAPSSRRTISRCRFRLCAGCSATARSGSSPPSPAAATVSRASSLRPAPPSRGKAPDAASPDRRAENVPVSPLASGRPVLVVLPFADMTGDTGAGVFRRRHHRGPDHRPLAPPPVFRHRPQLGLLLQGPRHGRAAGRAGTRGLATRSRAASARRVARVRITAQLERGRDGAAHLGQAVRRRGRAMSSGCRTGSPPRWPARSSPSGARGRNRAHPHQAHREPRRPTTCTCAPCPHRYTTRADNDEALRLLRRALQLDPGLSAAKGALAGQLVLRVTQGWAGEGDVEEGARCAREVVDAGGADDPTGARLGGARARLPRPGATKAGWRPPTGPCGSRPNSGVALYLGAWSRLYVGDWRTAVAWDRARGAAQPRGSEHVLLRRRPRGGLCSWASATRRRWSGRRRAAHDRPEYLVAHRLLAASLALLGRLDEARAAIPDLLAVAPATPWRRRRRTPPSAARRGSVTSTGCGAPGCPNSGSERRHRPAWGRSGDEGSRRP